MRTYRGRKYKELETKMFHEEISRMDVCKALARGRSYVDQRFAGHGSFDIREMYIICDLADIPLDQIAHYFPPEAVGLPPAKKGSAAQ